MSESGTLQDPLPLHPADLLILLALAEEGRHGYALLGHLATEDGGGIRLDAGNLYRRLRRLLDQGWVERSKPAPDTGDDPRRRYYHLTHTGRAVALAETERLRRVVEGAARSLGLPVSSGCAGALP